LKDLKHFFIIQTLINLFMIQTLTL